jgi:hypothetical protein
VRQFVEECRREWKRLGVPDPVANEMAADLEADLQEAEAEGASAEAVLGRSAFDPRSFAAAWAQPRSWLPAAIAVFAGVAILGVLLAIFAPRPQFRTARLALNSLPAGRPGIRTFAPVPSILTLPRGIIVGPRRAVGPIEVVGDGPRRKLQAVGLILLLIGITGLVASLMYRSRRLLR